MKIVDILARYRDAGNKKTPRILEPYVHVSDLKNFLIPSGYCPIQHKKALLKHRQGLSIDTSLLGHKAKLPMSLVWDMGRAIEERIRTALYHESFDGDMVGAFTCECGYTSFKGKSNKAYVCKKCKTPACIYQEVPIILGALKGTPDLIMRVQSSYGLKYSVVEIKSMNAKEFEFMKTRKIRSGYVKQVLFYMLMLKKIKEKGEPTYLGIPWKDINTDSVMFILVCKDFKKDTHDAVNVVELKLEDIDTKHLSKCTRMVNYFSSIEDITAYNGIGKGFNTQKQFVNEEACKNCPFIEECRAEQPDA
jgi:hypothetical protein